jgi:recombination protein RecA
VPASTSHARDRLAALNLPGTVWIGSATAEPVRRLETGVRAVDDLFAGGLPRGRLSEIVGGASSGRTGLVHLFLASATRRGEVAAIVDLADALDPPTLGEAGADLDRILWVRPPDLKIGLKCTELLLSAGGFGLVFLDLGITAPRRLPQHVWPRLAQAARKARTAVAVLAEHRVAGSFAALSAEVAPRRVHWEGRVFAGIEWRVLTTRGLGAGGSGLVRN